MNQTVILCGGKGTRLRSVTGDVIPKVMVEVCGRPLLEYHVQLLKANGIEDVIFCTGHLSEAIENHFGDGATFGLCIRYTREPRALGTAGAVLQVPFELDHEFFVLYGDVFVNVDLARMAAFHGEKGGEAALLVHPSEHPHDSDLVVRDPATDRITAFPGRPKAGQDFVNLTSAALYVCRRDLVRHIPADRPTDFARDIFPDRLTSGAPLYAYCSDEYVHDLGTAERYARVVADAKRMIEWHEGVLFGG